jgi:hypothetical protein
MDPRLHRPDHQYIVRTFFGPEASEVDQRIAERIVASIQFETG